MSSLTNTSYFYHSPRRCDAGVLNIRQGAVTKECVKISVPEWNNAFAPSLRYVSSEYIHTPSLPSLDLGQKYYFGVEKILL